MSLRSAQCQYWTKKKQQIIRFFLNSFWVQTTVKNFEDLKSLTHCSRGVFMENPKTSNPLWLMTKKRMLRKTAVLWPHASTDFKNFNGFVLSSATLSAVKEIINSTVDSSKKPGSYASHNATGWCPLHFFVCLFVFLKELYWITSFGGKNNTSSGLFFSDCRKFFPESQTTLHSSFHRLTNTPHD